MALNSANFQVGQALTHNCPRTKTTTPAEFRGYHYHAETGQRVARCIFRPADGPPFEASVDPAELSACTNFGLGISCPCPSCKGNQKTIVAWYGNRPVIGNCPACKATGLWAAPAEFVCEWQGGGKASVPCIVYANHRAVHIENYPIHQPGTTTAEYVLINGHRFEAAPMHLREIYAPAEQAEMLFYGDYFPAATPATV